ncbi:poly-gamma-glutamate synthesis protein (capsule biosynthesis protein) [Naumannella cuiyingiana]|uniref:Poly-gamma-glutamate synthesis protein (Capsule biosynthesis protein) n=1 Tax=Naumannella cuiyingiana TaxID=1347891 RepID=A0A7Z0D710_9ACTN|nr:CapA family protein [Naumannella cuiyingiana]NYI70061.1 poly-gamma-glutamate synthesis protein (capsule biosynthesis protein) [Naumannella cuiyingiana]
MRRIPPRRRAVHGRAARAVAAVALTVAALTVAGCTAPRETGPRETNPRETGPRETNPGASAPLSPAPAGTPSTAPRVPLVLAAHATRPVLDIDAAAAQALLAGGADDWADLGLPRGRLRVTSALPDRAAPPGAAEAATPAEALDRVRADPDTLALVPADAVDPTVRVLTVGGAHPLADPTRYPLTTSGRPPQSVATVTIVGDIMLGRRVGDSLAAGEDPTAVFAPLADRLSGADLTVGTFEAALSDDGPPYQGADSFHADPEIALAGLDRAGFDAVSLANNHVGDFGTGALVTTFDIFDEAGIGRFGAGRDVAAARAPLIMEAQGQRIAFIGTESIEGVAATEDSPGVNRLSMPPRTGPLNRAEREATLQVIREAAADADVVIVMPHWGTQYTHEVEDSQRETARAFADAGADLVIGGHPHWVQGWEQLDDTTVAYSLGNFIFDMSMNDQVRQGVFVEITSWDGTVVAVDPVAHQIGDDHAPRLADDRARAEILGDLASTSSGPFADPDA